VAIARVCGIAPGAPTGGCDPPQPGNIAAATPMVRATRPKSKLIIFLAPPSWSKDQPRRCGSGAGG